MESKKSPAKFVSFLDLSALSEQDGVLLEKKKLRKLQSQYSGIVQAAIDEVKTDNMK